MSKVKLNFFKINYFKLDEFLLKRVQMSWMTWSSIISYVVGGWVLKLLLFLYPQYRLIFMSHTFFKYNFFSWLTGHLCTSNCCTRYLHEDLICRYLKLIHRLSIWTQFWNNVSRVSKEKQSFARSTRVMLAPNLFSIKKLEFSMDNSFEALHFGRIISVKENSPHSSLV